MIGASQESGAGGKTMIEYPGEFEIHMTVRTADALAQSFRNWCDKHSLKCVRIVLSRGHHREQPMSTWCRVDTNLSTVLAEARRYVELARQDGHDVVRLKVEALLSNQDVPQTDAAAANCNSGNYFEHHLKLRRRVDEPTEVLRGICEMHAAHLSRNAFERVEAGEYEHRFVTLRSYGIGASASIDQLARLLTDLKNIDQQVVEKESEYCVYDSNVDLDAGWLPASKTVDDLPIIPIRESTET